MPRKLKLSPGQGDLLLMLEEAGSESLETVLATLKPKDLKVFNRQVEELIELGLIRREEFRGETELVLTESGAKAVRT
jgi:predicted transcriptional regulator